MQKRGLHAFPKVQFFRYAFVGGVATLVDMGVYGTLTHLGGVEHWIALAASFGAGVVTNFGLSRQWAFKARVEKWHRQFIRFLVVIGVIYLVNGWFMRGLYFIWPPMIWRNFWVRGLAAIGTLPLSYYLHRRVSFRQGPIFS